MPIKFFRKYVPDAREVRGRRMVAMFGGWLHHPNLWCLNRRSVAGAVAIGLFTGLIPGPLQMLGAVLLCIPLKKNLPVALVTTFYTNPLTIVPIYMVAYQYGALFIPGAQRAEAPPFGEIDGSDWLGSLQAMLDWMLALGQPLAVGLIALAMTLAFAGYFAVLLGWRAYIVLAWRRRKKKRLSR